MARKPRLEIEGGLYHLITRGNDRQDIFHDPEDHRKFLALLEKQKLRCSFFLYAYCLMTNHVHLLIERQAEPIGRIMQRLLTAYSQYYNRKYRRVGHVFQGRHKAILCQSQGYLGRLVRYIHLNPVRARMVTLPEHYPYSSHSSYLGIVPAGIVDVDPVLRLFGNKREIAVQHFQLYVGTPCDEDDGSYSCAENNILGSEEFVDDAIHRLGEAVRGTSRTMTQKKTAFDSPKLLAAVEAALGISQDEFCRAGKNARAVMAKGLFILVGRDAGAGLKELSEITGLDISGVSRRYEAARNAAANDVKFEFEKQLIEQKYESIAETQA
ncbi:MAG: transposase [Pyrinomonadaceae bacterium]